MPSMLTGDYEQLRAAALTPRSSSAGSSCAQRLVDEGLYAWLMNRGGAQWRKECEGYWAPRRCSRERATPATKAGVGIGGRSRAQRMSQEEGL